MVRARARACVCVYTCVQCTVHRHTVAVCRHICHGACVYMSTCVHSCACGAHLRVPSQAQLAWRHLPRTICVPCVCVCVCVCVSPPCIASLSPMHMRMFSLLSSGVCSLMAAKRPPPCVHTHTHAHTHTHPVHVSVPHTHTHASRTRDVKDSGTRQLRFVERVKVRLKTAVTISCDTRAQ